MPSASKACLKTFFSKEYKWINRISYMAFQENGASHYSFVTGQNDYREEPDNFYSCDKYPCSSTYSVTPNESRGCSATAHKQIMPRGCKITSKTLRERRANRSGRLNQKFTVTVQKS